MLVLGHFKGAPTPHTRIPLNQGICGAAASSGKTVIVDDVQSDSRYLACSIETKSEIVAPIFVAGKVVGELDIDSHVPAAFTAEDRQLVEYCAALVGKLWKALPHESRKRPGARARDRTSVAQFASIELPPIARPGGAGRFLGLHLRQLHPHPALRAGVARALSRQGPDGHRRPHARIHVCAIRIERRARHSRIRAHLSCRARQQMEIWKAFANRFWPTKYLLDKDGYLRFAHFGEGGYAECEQVIQELLHEIDPALVLPEIMAPVRGEDRARCDVLPPRRSFISGIAAAALAMQAAFMKIRLPTIHSRASSMNIASTPAGNGHRRWNTWKRPARANIVSSCRYSAAAVNLVMASPRGPACEVIVRQDGKPLRRDQRTPDTRFRTVANAANQEESHIVVQQARMYAVLDNHDFGEHILELICPAGLAVFAFTFTSCVDPIPSAVSAATVAMPA